MNIPTPLSTQLNAPTNPAGISRRAAMGRLGALGGAFLAWNFLGDCLAQSTSTPDMVAEMRKVLGATPPVSTKLAEGLQLISGPGGNIARAHLGRTENWPSIPASLARARPSSPD